ncbi:MAG: cupin domain-containing protein [Verrucomicrobiota bacterium]
MIIKVRVIAIVLLPLALFAHSEKSGVRIEVLEQSTQMWNGEELPAYPDEAAQISVVKVTVPPHTKLGWHKHPCINAGYLLTGEIRVTAEDGSTRLVKSGEGLIELVDIWHYGENVSDEVAEIIVIYVGAEGVPLALPKPIEKSL